MLDILAKDSKTEDDKIEKSKQLHSVYMELGHVNLLAHDFARGNILLIFYWENFLQHFLLIKSHLMLAQIHFGKMLVVYTDWVFRIFIFGYIIRKFLNL